MVLPVLAVSRVAWLDGEYSEAHARSLRVCASSGMPGGSAKDCPVAGLRRSRRCQGGRAAPFVTCTEAVARE